MNQRELDILYAEAEAEVEELWQEFMREWLAERAQEDMNGEARAN